MSLRLCPFTSSVILDLVKLAFLPHWDTGSLNEAFRERGWPPVRDGRVAIDSNHTLVLCEPESPDGPYEAMYVASAVFYEPDPDDDLQDDELTFDWEEWGPSGWGLSDDGSRADFDAAWTDHRDIVSATLGANPAKVLTDREYGWRTALWPLGEHVLALAQTEHFDSYSLFDMTALWVCRRVENQAESFVGDSYRWIVDFPELLR